MNWALVAFPLVSSLALLTALLTFLLLPKVVLERVKMEPPRAERKEIDPREIEKALSKVFPRTEGMEVSKTAEELPQAPTKGNLKLKLLAVSSGARSIALLEVGGKKIVLEEGKSWKGLTLKRVFPKEVVVSYGGKDIRVKLEKGKGYTSKNQRAESASAQEFKISRREIERVTKDPGIMFRQIRLIPYVKNGRTEGFIFEWIKPGSLFYKAGLRKGDILVSINNMSIRSGEDAFRILQVLRNEPSLRVVVLRGGQRKEINVRIE